MTAPTANEVLDAALNELIADAAGFRSRERRDRPVLFRFTEAELTLIDKLAADKGITRIDLLRRLLDAGIGHLGDAHRIATVASRVVRALRGRGMVSSLPAGIVTELEEAIAELVPVTRSAGPRREIRVKTHRTPRP